MFVIIHCQVFMFKNNKGEQKQQQQNPCNECTFLAKQSASKIHMYYTVFVIFLASQ